MQGQSGVLLPLLPMQQGSLNHQDPFIPPYRTHLTANEVVGPTHMDPSATTPEIINGAVTSRLTARGLVQPPVLVRVATHGKRAAPFSRLLRQAVGYLGSILPRNPHGATNI